MAMRRPGSRRLTLQAYLARYRWPVGLRGLLFLLLTAVGLAACESGPAFPVPPGPPVPIAVDARFARWTLGRWAIDSFDEALATELAKYDIAVVDARTHPPVLVRVNLGILGYRHAVDTELVRGDQSRRLQRVLVPDLQATTLAAAAQLVAAVIARAVWYPPHPPLP